jgi:hypothetical protein
VTNEKYFKKVWQERQHVRRPRMEPIQSWKCGIQNKLKEIGMV